MMDAATDAEVVREVGARLKAYRLQRNITVETLARQSGLHRNTILNAEAGANPRLETVVRILRVLGRLDAFDAFLPRPAVSPLALIERAGKTRKRARAARRR